MKKSEKLIKVLSTMNSCLVAYSGGVDSTFLLAAAKDALGKEKVLAVTADSETYTKDELKEARKYARLIGVRHRTIKTEEIKDRNFSSNPPERCRNCQRLFMYRFLAGDCFIKQPT